MALRFKAINPFSHIEGSKKQVETLVSKFTELNLKTKTFSNDISFAEPIEAAHKEVGALAVPLSLVNRITMELDLQTILLPTAPANPASRNNNPSLNEPIQSSRGEKLIRWILTSHNMYGLAVTVLHNFVDICCQKPEERNFINRALSKLGNKKALV